ncbi:MAG: hypothetical protein K0R14_1784 [Burkholderiales bacterium]|nr:hypothetical protein [Burkholderiales bacterium]
MKTVYKLKGMFGLFIILILSMSQVHADYIATFVPYQQVLPQHLPIYYAEKDGILLKQPTRVQAFSGFEVRLHTNNLDHVAPKNVRLPFAGTVTHISVTKVGDHYYIDSIEVKDGNYVSSVGNLRGDTAVVAPNRLISVDGWVLLKCYFDDEVHHYGDDGVLKIFGVFTTTPLMHVADQRSCNLL